MSAHMSLGAKLFILVTVWKITSRTLVFLLTAMLVLLYFVSIRHFALRSQSFSRQRTFNGHILSTYRQVRQPCS